MRPWIETYTGKRFYYDAPDSSMICIEDMAHSLANLCRFGGHVKTFYSVAEHSVRASYLCPEEDQLWCLLHDGTEAYYIDMPRPLKHMLGMESYRDQEKIGQKAIMLTFGLPIEEPQSVKDADTRMLYTEKRDLMTTKYTWETNWAEDNNKTLLTETIIPWTPEEAKNRFLMRHYELTGTRSFYKQQENDEKDSIAFNGSSLIHMC